MKKFYIVPHSHLDREWYRAFQENRIKLVYFLDDLFDTMENDPSYTCYNLDAQTSFIDDYFEIRPEKKELFKKLVQEGRLLIGPWYVQPDEHLPTAEGIIRNLLISRNISDEFGAFMPLCYAPDSFGQSASFPSLMKGFGIENAIFYRGFAEEDSIYNDFIWESPDKSRILANWMPVGYGNAMFLSEDDEKNIKEIEDNIRLLKDRSVSDNFLLMCGSDQSFIKKFLPKAVQRLNRIYQDKGMDYEFILASPMQYMDAVRPYSPQMEVVGGELRKGKRSRTHNSIGGTRMDIKQANFKAEQKYLKWLEPICALTSLFGTEDDRSLIHRGWKYIVESHAHDSICCCCTDVIHKEILMRLLYCNQLADFLIKDKMEKLHGYVSYDLSKGRPILVFSSCLGARKRVTRTDVYVKCQPFAIYDGTGRELDYRVIKTERFNLKDTKVSFTPIPDDYYDKVTVELCIETPGYGYSTLYIREGEEPSAIDGSMVKGRVLENTWLRVEVEEDGSLSVTDRETGKIFRNQHIIADDGNAGDEYDYSPAGEDRRYTSLRNLVSVETAEDGPLCAGLKCRYVMQVPETTSNERRSDRLVPLCIDTTVTLYRDDRQAYFHTVIDNQAENHRIQVLFDAGEKLDRNFADIQLGELERENEFALTEESVTSGWYERYYPVFNQHKYSGLHTSDGNGFVIMNQGLPQYEIYNENSTVLALTLLSCVGFMGNVNLKYRPGRRSGSADATPDSQMKGRFEADYTFMPITPDRDYIQEAENYWSPLYAFCSPEFDGDGMLPDHLTAASSKDGLLATCFKGAERGDSRILRVLNPYPHKKEQLTLQINRFLFGKIDTVNLAEKEIEDKRVHVKKLNNPDGSAKAVMSGTVQIKEMERNQLMSFRLGTDK